jgi:coenzyme F420-0:L-glutamate ligase/coenzyme F420-1:gamma-L-glutamate ligase
VVAGDRGDLLAGQTERVVARRGGTAIVRTPQGLVLAAAGIDGSNTEPGTAVLLPEEPDRSARQLREALHANSGRNVAVVVSDTAGRAWREGQTDQAVGVAGLPPLLDLAGLTDPHGNRLTVTAPAVADAVAAAADLVKGKLSRCPAAVVSGLARQVLPAGEHGPGAVALVRAPERDLFGYGARDAVLAAVGAAVRGAALPGQCTVRDTGFGEPARADEVTRSLRDLLAPLAARVEPEAEDVVVVELPADDPALATCCRVAAYALGWGDDDALGTRVRLRPLPATP